MKATYFSWVTLWAAILSGPAAALDVADPTQAPYARPVQASAARDGGDNATALNGPAGTPAPRNTAPGEAAPDSRPAVTRSARLSAILMADAPGRHAAVIDGQVRHVGDRLDGGTIALIQADGVSISHARRTVRLSLYDRAPEPKAAESAPAKVPAPSLPVSTPSGSSAPDKEQP